MARFDPVALECLAAIVEEGGFDRAARSMTRWRWADQCERIIVP